MSDSAHDDEVRGAFSAQAEGFNTSAVANAPDLLDVIVAQARPEPGDIWLEAACGPGILARRLAPSVARVEGVDLTPAMIELARAEATRLGIGNVEFETGDVDAVDRPDGFYDGAVTRFSVHHLSSPEGMFAELTRVVRPGGRIVVADHLADVDADAAIWSTGIERLRDPSHWSCRTAHGLRTLGTNVGLRLVEETTIPVVLDFADWVERGGADPVSRRRVEQALTRRPATVRNFTVTPRPDGIPSDPGHGPRTLTLQVWCGTWVR